MSCVVKCHAMTLANYFSFSMKNLFFFFFNDTATTEIYTLSLHDALPILISSGRPHSAGRSPSPARSSCTPWCCSALSIGRRRSEEHTSELQSLTNLVCRLLLEKKKHSFITCCFKRWALSLTFPCLLSGLI